MKSTLLAVRLPPRMLAELHDCPGILDRFRILAIGQHSEEEVRFAARGRPINYLQDWPDESDREATAALYRGLLASCNVSHAIIAQPLLWYSNVVDSVLDDWRFGPRPVRRFWLEAYFDRAYLDELGALYTPENEVREFETAAAPEGFPRPVSKFEQPAARGAESLWSEFGGPERVVVVFGQVPDDMSLVIPDGELGYFEWLDAIFAGNPETPFLFKHHPKMRTALPAYPNVVEIDVDVLSLTSAYRYAAAFSSTVIVEGCARGCLFATGGHHAMFGHTLPIRTRVDAPGLVGNLAAVEPDDEAIVRRLGFLERCYSVRLSDPCVLDRLTIDRRHVVDWYAARAWR